MELVSTAGGKVGYHHYEKRSATKIAEFISAQMHKQLIKHILETDSPFSLITDGATDTRQNHYLSVLLQGLENNMPKVYMYRLLLIGEGEKASDLLELIVSIRRGWDPGENERKSDRIYIGWNCCNAWEKEWTW